MAAVVDTRTRLLEAAIEIIDTKGEVGLRVRDIAAAAGVTEPSIYHFFGSREGLIIAAQAHRYVHGQVAAFRNFEQAVYTCRTKKQFVQIARQTLTAVYENPQAVGVRSARVNVLGSAQTRPELARQLADAQRVANKALAEPLRFARDKGWVRKDVDLEILAAWVIGQINGRVLMEIDPIADDMKKWDDISIDAVLTMLGHPSAYLKTP
jgi:AcrR family transcriptional regulator